MSIPAPSLSHPHHSNPAIGIKFANILLEHGPGCQPGASGARDGWIEEEYHVEIERLDLRPRPHRIGLRRRPRGDPAEDGHHAAGRSDGRAPPGQPDPRVE